MTTDQENRVLTMLNAFENGKRLVDLPNASGNNPFDMTVEVLEDGESKQAKLAALLPNIESEVMYGVEWDHVTSSSPAVTRIGNTSLHKSLPIQNRMRGCLLNDAGEVVKYLNPLTWEDEVRDGSMGQVMVELPSYYRKFETDGNKRRVKLSEYPLPGYHQVPTMYVSAYEASLDSSSKLASISNVEITDGVVTSETSSHIIPRNGSSNSLKAEARRRNNNDTRWNIYTYDCWKNIYWLYVVEYANFNSQLAYNSALTSDGYKQGGLGAGVTNMSFEQFYYCFNGHFLPCGYTDSLGNRTGVVHYEETRTYAGDSNLAAGTYTASVDIPRYRGIENPFGHIYKTIDGINYYHDEETGSISVYVCHKPSKYAYGTSSNYLKIGETPNSASYTKKWLFGEEGDLVPIEVGGSTTTFMCDYYQCPASNYGFTVVLSGGLASHGAAAGLGYVGAHLVSSYSAGYIGARLCFIPTEETI